MPEEVKIEKDISPDKDVIPDKEEILEEKPEVDIQMPLAAAAPAVAEEAPVRQGRDFGPGRGSQMSDRKKFFYTKKVCKYCTRQIDEKMIDYKNIDTLKRYVMPSGKILPRRISGNCAKHQRKIVREIKKARIIALLPFLDR